MRPLPPNQLEPEASGEVAAREAQLLEKLEALQAENLHLRRQYAVALGAKSADGSEGARSELPLPLRPQVKKVSPSAHPVTSQMDHESLMAALASVFPIGIFRTDSAGLLTHVDESLQRIFDLAAEDFPNFGWVKRVHPEDTERVQQAWVKGIRNGEFLSIEFRIVRSDGTITHVLARNAAISDAEGNLVAQHGFLQDVSSLRKLQAEAQFKDDLNRQIIASSPDCAKVLDLQGRVVQMTEKGCQLVEVDDFESVRGSHWADWWAGEEKLKALKALSSAAQGEQARFTAFGKTFKGTPKWWDTVVTPILDAQGQVAMLLAVSRDISDIHRQQEEIRSLNDSLEARVAMRTRELAQANERLAKAYQQAKYLYDEAPCGYHSVDENGAVVNVNQTALNWFGFTSEQELEGANYRDLLRPDFLQAQEERFMEVKQNKPVPPVEVCAYRKDGSEIWVLLSTTAALDSEGRFSHAHNAMVDITERHAAEAALVSQRHFLQTMSNAVPVQLAFFDRDLICRFANASYARWVDGNPASVVGKHLRDIAKDSDFQRGQPILEAALNGVSQRFEGPRVFPDGHHFYASIQYTPYVERGQVLGLIIQMVDISERRASELELEQTNQTLGNALAFSQSLYNQAPCGYYSLDANGVYVAMNDTMLQWLGYAREEVVGKLHYRSVTAEPELDAAHERLERMVKGETVGNKEYELRHRDGRYFSALVSSSAICDANGNFLRTNTSVVDISARKAAELALWDSQRFLTTITEHMSGGVAYVDAQLRFQFVNEPLAQLYGVPADKIIGKRARDCLPPEVWRDVAPRLERALVGEIQQYEAWRETAKGQKVCVAIHYIPDFFQGELKGLYVQVADITGQKRIEERMNHLNEELENRVKERSLELLESEQRFRLMVDNLREYCMFFFDVEGNITDWTDSAQRMEGYSPTETLGRHYSILFHRKKPDEARTIGNRLMATAAARGQNELHGWYERKDGTQYWAHSVIIALRDDHGELRGFAKINRDMTDAKRLDDLMRNINDELENRVADRTEQLLLANKDLESFSYSVSHDLRSPLRHISSFVSLLEEHMADSQDEEALRYLGTISNSTRHMAQLIEGLLAFARLGRAAVTSLEVDMSALVETVLNQLEPDTRDRSVQWVVAPDLPVVFGDGLLLREVWTNLLSNALKYSRPREHARIEVGWSVDPAMGYIFSVTDNGVGFNTQHAGKLFGVFQRLHRASEFEGTGIGLALTRRIMERHGGSIWADSRLGEGSVFSFSLPFERTRPETHPMDTIPAMLEQ